MLKSNDLLHVFYAVVANIFFGLLSNHIFKISQLVIDLVVETTEIL
jgi:hypothetical protein